MGHTVLRGRKTGLALLRAVSSLNRYGHRSAKYFVCMDAAWVEQRHWFATEWRFGKACHGRSHTDDAPEQVITRRTVTRWDGQWANAL